MISVSTAGNPEHIRRWFDRAHAGVSTGSWILKGTKIEFTTLTKAIHPNDQPVKVDYTGTVSDHSMQLSAYSHKTQYRGKHKFEFSALELSPK